MECEFSNSDSQSQSAKTLAIPIDIPCTSVALISAYLLVVVWVNIKYSNIWVNIKYSKIVYKIKISEKIYTIFFFFLVWWNTYLLESSKNSDK